MGLVVLDVGTQKLHGLWLARGLTSTAVGKARSDNSAFISPDTPCRCHLCHIVPWALQG